MDRKPTFFHIVASSMLLLLLQGQAADATPTYRWVDDNGNPVHASELRLIPRFTQMNAGRPVSDHGCHVYRSLA